MFDVSGKVIVITGGASGIGFASARRFSSCGAKVVIADLNDNSKVAESIGAVFVKTDVSDETQVAKMIGFSEERFGLIDILVNCAGVVIPAAITEIDKENFDKHFGVNLGGIIWTVKHAVPKMRDGGMIINIASACGVTAIPFYGSYSATKAAVMNYTKMIAVELGNRRIRAVAICPGTIDTPMARAPGTGDELAFIETLAVLRRLGKPEEVAALIHFLAADDCRYITGESIVIDGGGMNGCLSIPLVNTVVAAASREG